MHAANSNSPSAVEENASSYTEWEDLGDLVAFYILFELFPSCLSKYHSKFSCSFYCALFIPIIKQCLTELQVVTGAPIDFLQGNG